ILLLDEPFAGVDPIAVADIQEIVRQLRQRGISILLTDHNVRETLAITDRSYIIFEGRILRHGRSEDLVNDPVVRQVYLGKKFRMPELSERDDG
ncbi:MAG: LPS export ABC transporter ATP-binding protein, partial [Planctomycetota bacterium]